MRRCDAGCASGSFFGGCWEESTAPGAASAARAGVRFSFAGRSAVLQRGRSGPALLRYALRCSCRAVACGDPDVSCDMGRRPLVRRRWRRGSPLPARQGMPPPAPRPPRSPRQSRLRSRTSLVPSCPASHQMVSRSRRPAVFDAHAAGAYVPAHGASGRFAPVAPKSAWRIRARCRCISPATPECASIPEAAPRRRQPRAMAAPPTPDSRRPSGLPVCRSGLRLRRHQGGSKDGFRIAPAPRRHHHRVFSSLAAAALQRRLAPRHYRIARANPQDRLCL